MSINLLQTAQKLISKSCNEFTDMDLIFTLLQDPNFIEPSLKKDLEFLLKALLNIDHIYQLLLKAHKKPTLFYYETNKDIESFLQGSLELLDNIPDSSEEFVLSQLGQLEILGQREGREGLKDDRIKCFYKRIQSFYLNIKAKSFKDHWEKAAKQLGLEISMDLEALYIEIKSFIEEIKQYELEITKELDILLQKTDILKKIQEILTVKQGNPSINQEIIQKAKDLSINEDYLLFQTLQKQEKVASTIYNYSKTAILTQFSANSFDEKLIYSVLIKDYLDKKPKFEEIQLFLKENTNILLNNPIIEDNLIALKADMGLIVQLQQEFNSIKYHFPLEKDFFNERIQIKLLELELKPLMASYVKEMPFHLESLFWEIWLFFSEFQILGLIFQHHKSFNHWNLWKKEIDLFIERLPEKIKVNSLYLKNNSEKNIELYNNNEISQIKPIDDDIIENEEKIKDGDNNENLKFSNEKMNIIKNIIDNLVEEATNEKKIPENKRSIKLDDNLIEDNEVKNISSIEETQFKEQNSQFIQLPEKDLLTDDNLKERGDQRLSKNPLKYIQNSLKEMSFYKEFMDIYNKAEANLQTSSYQSIFHLESKLFTTNKPTLDDIKQLKASLKALPIDFSSELSTLNKLLEDFSFFLEEYSWFFIDKQAKCPLTQAESLFSKLKTLPISLPSEQAFLSKELSYSNELKSTLLEYKKHPWEPPSFLSNYQEHTLLIPEFESFLDYNTTILQEARLLQEEIAYFKEETKENYDFESFLKLYDKFEAFETSHKGLPGLKRVRNTIKTSLFLIKTRFMSKAISTNNPNILRIPYKALQKDLSIGYSLIKTFETAQNLSKPIYLIEQCLTIAEETFQKAIKANSVEEISNFPLLITNFLDISEELLEYKASLAFNKEGTLQYESNNLKIAKKILDKEGFFEVLALLKSQKKASNKETEVIRRERNKGRDLMKQVLKKFQLNEQNQWFFSKKIEEILYESSKHDPKEGYYQNRLKKLCEIMIFTASGLKLVAKEIRKRGFDQESILKLCEINDLKKIPKVILGINMKPGKKRGRKPKNSNLRVKEIIEKKDEEFDDIIKKKKEQEFHDIMNKKEEDFQVKIKKKRGRKRKNILQPNELDKGINHNEFNKEYVLDFNKEGKEFKNEDNTQNTQNIQNNYNIRNKLNIQKKYNIHRKYNSYDKKGNNNKKKDNDDSNNLEDNTKKEDNYCLYNENKSDKVKEKKIQSKSKEINNVKNTKKRKKIDFSTSVNEIGKIRKKRNISIKESQSNLLKKTTRLNKTIESQTLLHKYIKKKLLSSNQTSPITRKSHFLRKSHQFQEKKQVKSKFIGLKEKIPQKNEENKKKPLIKPSLTKSYKSESPKPLLKKKLIPTANSNKELALLFEKATKNEKENTIKQIIQPKRLEMLLEMTKRKKVNPNPNEGALFLEDNPRKQIIQINSSSSSEKEEEVIDNPILFDPDEEIPKKEIIGIDLRGCNEDSEENYYVTEICQNTCLENNEIINQNEILKGETSRSIEKNYMENNEKVKINQFFNQDDSLKTLEENQKEKKEKFNIKQFLFYSERPSSKIEINQEEKFNRNQIFSNNKLSKETEKNILENKEKNNLSEIFYNKTSKQSEKIQPISNEINKQDQLFHTNKALKQNEKIEQEKNSIDQIFSNQTSKEKSLPVSETNESYDKINQKLSKSYTKSNKELNDFNHLIIKDESFIPIVKKNEKINLKKPNANFLFEIFKGRLKYNSTSNKTYIRMLSNSKPEIPELFYKNPSKPKLLTSGTTNIATFSRFYFENQHINRRDMMIGWVEALDSISQRNLKSLAEELTQKQEIMGFKFGGKNCGSIHFFAVSQFEQDLYFCELKQKTQIYQEKGIEFHPALIFLITINKELLEKNQKMIEFKTILKGNNWGLVDLEGKREEYEEELETGFRKMEEEINYKKQIENILDDDDEMDLDEEIAENEKEEFLNIFRRKKKNFF